jgi:hypothetical protein
MVTVTLGVPRRAGRDWLCPYSIRGLAVRERLKAYGSDELQALSNALGLIDMQLHRSGRRLAWFPDGDPWTGFVKLVPLPPPFHALRRRVDRFVEREAARITRRLAARHRRRRARRRRRASSPRGLRARARTG